MFYADIFIANGDSMFKRIAALVAALFLSACVGVTPGALRHAADQSKGPAQELADKIVQVPAQYRPLRVCLFVALAGEVMKDRVLLYDPGKASEVLGRMLALNGAVETARGAAGAWLNADMADVSIMFAAVLADLGESRVTSILTAGLSPSAVIGGMRRAAVTTVKGAAMLRDIDAMVADLTADRVGEQAVWDSCLQRIKSNQTVLLALTGARLTL